MDGRHFGLRNGFLRGAASLAVLLLVAAAAGGCTGGMRNYDTVMRGRNACDPCVSTWHQYDTVMRGRNACDPCPATWHRYDTVMLGRNACADGACGACAPCAPCAPAPCAPCAPVAVAPCAPPCGPMPAAQPGEAWCRVTVPAQYETVTETVRTSCGVCTKVWVPPVMEYRTREVCVTPACSREIDVPGASRTVRSCEIVCPSRTEVRKVSCGGCGCPPQDCFQTVEVPAVTRPTSHEVCIQAPSKRVVYMPPLYRTDLVPCEVQPGCWRTVETPPVYETVSRQVCTCPERTFWKKNETCVVPQIAPTPCTPTAPVPVPSAR